jgi:hypothetical protein
MFLESEMALMQAYLLSQTPRAMILTLLLAVSKLLTYTFAVRW